MIEESNKDRLKDGKFKKNHKLNNGIKREMTPKMLEAVNSNLEKARLARMSKPIKYYGRRCVGVRPDKTFVVFQSCRFAQRILNKPNGTIANKCQGKRKNRFAYGYFWFWENTNEWIDFINNTTDKEIKGYIENYKKTSRERKRKDETF